MTKCVENELGDHKFYIKMLILKQIYTNCFGFYWNKRNMHDKVCRKRIRGVLEDISCTVKC